MVPALALTLVLGTKEAVGAVLMIADGTKHTLALTNGQLQDLTIPAGFVGRVTLQVEGGDGGNGRARLALFTAFGVGGPGARVIASFDVGPGTDRISAGSTLRFFIGRKGESENEIIVNGVSEPDEATSNSPEAAGGGGGTAVYLGQSLLVGAGGGGGGKAQMSVAFPVIVPVSADGRYGRYIGDGYGTTLNGGEGGGSVLDSGNGGVFNATTQTGAGGETGVGSGGGGGTASDGESEENVFAEGGGQATHLNVSPGGDGVASGGGGWGGGGGGDFNGGGGGLSGGRGGGSEGGGGGGGSAYSTGYGSRGQSIVARATRSEARLPQDGSASYTLTPAYTLVPSEIQANADPGTASVQIVATGTDTAAPWSTSVAPSWLRINHVNQVSGSGSANLQISFDANTTGAQRTGTITVFGQTLTVTQSAQGTGSTNDTFAITASETIPPGFTWNLQSGSVLTIPHGRVLAIAAGATLINSGSIINNGTLAVLQGGTLVNQAGGKINNTGYFSKMVNNGSLENHGAIYDPWVHFSGTPATDKPVSSRHFYLGVDSGGPQLSPWLSGAWDESSLTCTMSNYWLKPGYTLEVGSGVTLAVNGTLSNDGTLVNGGTISNAVGTIRNCGTYRGNAPTPNPLGDCVLTEDELTCASMGGIWNATLNVCYVNRNPVTVAAGQTLTIRSGSTFFFSKPLANYGTIVNQGNINYNSYEGPLENHNAIINYGSFESTGHAEHGAAYMINEGNFLNYGGLWIGWNSYLENNSTITNYGSLGFSDPLGIRGGTIMNQCGSTFSFTPGPLEVFVRYEYCPPTITLFEPSLDVRGAATALVSWDDAAPNTNAAISLYYRDYRDNTTNNAVLIVDGLPEDPDGAMDQYVWNLSAVPPGSYSVYAVIRDGTSTVMSSAAAGVVTVLPEGGITLESGLSVQGNGITLAWPANLKGVTLQSTSELGENADWTTVLTTPTELNGQMVVEEPKDGGSKFYRLWMP